MSDEATIQENAETCAPHDILINQLAALTNQLASTGDLLKALGQQLETFAGKPAPEKRSSIFGKSKVPGTNAPGTAKSLARLEELGARNVELAENIKSRDREISELKKRLGLLADLQMENGALKKQLAEKQDENEKLKEERKDLDAKYKEQWGETARAITGLENRQAALEALQSDFEQCQSELAHKQNEIDGINDALEKCRSEFARIQAEKFTPLADALAHIPAEFRPLVQSYYEIDNLPEFLTQCGHFNRLSQLWQSCRSNIVNGEKLDGIEVFLLRVLDIYNKAFPENPGREIMPRFDTCYDYNTQERVGGNGTKVSSVILPGLAQPNGQVVVKALVRLN